MQWTCIPAYLKAHKHRCGLVLIKLIKFNKKKKITNEQNIY